MKKPDAARYPELVTDAFLCVLLLVYPLWFGPGGYTTMTEVKYGFFMWMSIIYLAVMLLLTGALILIGKGREIFLRVRHFGISQAFVLVFVLFSAISAALSQYGAKVWLGAGRFEGLSTILLYAGLFLVVSLFGKFKKWHLYLAGVVVLVNAVIGFLQYAGLNPFHLYPEGYTYHDAFVLYSGAFMGTLGNIDLLSAFFSLLLPLLYCYYVLRDKSSLLLIPFAAGIFTLLLTGVSAGLTGIGAGLFVTLPLISNTKTALKKTLTAGSLAVLCAAVAKSISVTYVDRVTVVGIRFSGLALVLLVVSGILLVLMNLLDQRDAASGWDDRKVRKYLWIGVAGVFVAVIGILWAVPFGSGSLASAHRLLHGEINPKEGSSRIQIWQNVLPLVPEHLLFGGGPDTLADRIQFSFQRYNEATGTNIQAFIDTAHNDYLNILVNTGLFSLLTYLAALVTAAVRSLKKAASNNILLVLAVALLCYLIQIFFSFSICIVSPFFWVFFGLLVASLNHDESEVKRK